MTPDFPIRPAFWNVPLWAEVGVYVLGLTALVLCIAGIVKSVRLWQAGKKEQSIPSKRSLRIKHLIGSITAQRRIRETSAGRVHFFLSWGFFFLFLGTAAATLDWDVGHYIVGKQFLRGNVYLAYKLILDIAGAVVLVALTLGALRRWKKGSTLPKDKRFFYAYSSLAFIILTGFVLEGLRLAVQQPAWAAFSPVGNTLAQLYLLIGLTPESLSGAHLWVWVIHGIVALGFVAAIPLTYYAHLYKTPSNIYQSKLEAPGALRKIDDLMECETFGVSSFDQFTQQNRLSFDACTECGRCNDVCPALRSGAPLAPRELILKLQQRLHSPDDKRELIGDIVSKDELWSCTTCGACAHACPADIALPDIIVSMRQHLALELGEFPDDNLRDTLENITTLGNPWGLDPDERLDWAKGLEVPIAREGEHYDVLYWVGCAASYDRRARKIARAMVTLLNAADINYAVMKEERCHAEFARRLGEEAVFQLAAEENAESFSRYQFDRVLVACPHCLNTLKNEYPAFNSMPALHVVSHAEYLEELMRAGKLPVVASTDKTVYHDPCYLARLNNVIAAPRTVLEAASEKLLCPAECAQKTFCCGAGGGQMWMEGQKVQKRINIIRLEELAATGAQRVAVACPHCLTMLESAKSQSGNYDELPVLDISEIVLEAWQRQKATS